MSYDQDPARWTSSPDEAPELLRGAFHAGRNEGPNRGQMRTLAVKLAAASAGGAVAVGTAKAASAGNALAGAANWSVAKIASVIALAGSMVTGAVIWEQTSGPSARTAAPDATQPVQSAEEAEAVGAPAAVPNAQQVATDEPTPAALAASGASAEAEGPQAIDAVEPAEPAQAVGPAEVPQVANGVEPTQGGAPTVQQLSADDGPRAVAEAAQPERLGATPEAPGDSEAERESGTATAQDVSGSRAPQRAARVRPRGAVRKATPQETESESAAASNGTRTTEGRVRMMAGSDDTADKPSELSLLHRAQAALDGRPGEAFKLTELHRRLYPSGEFAQERDALAIEALMRAGEPEVARDLARNFIRAYPSSPHAHRFREAMQLR